MKKLLSVIYFLIIIGMIALIPLVANDYLLTLLYVVILLITAVTKREKGDWLAVVIGLVCITISEYFFVYTGVETFARHTLFNIMPLWLPILWAFAFLVIKRTLRTLL